MSKATSSSIHPHIFLCQHRSCRKAGSAEVLQAFRELTPPQVSIFACGCLGHCGSGPNALVMPEGVEYHDVQPMTVASIVKRHWG